MVNLILVVGQHPSQTNIFGYKLSKPMFGALSPRKAPADNDTIVTEFTVDVSGDVIILCAKELLGATPIITLDNGSSVHLTYAAGGYTGKDVNFAKHVKDALDGVSNVTVDPTAAAPVAATKAQPTATATSPQADPVPAKPLNQMTKDELIAYAIANGITVPAGATKSAIMTDIEAAEA